MISVCVFDPCKSWRAFFFPFWNTSAFVLFGLLEMIENILSLCLLHACFFFLRASFSFFPFTVVSMCSSLLVSVFLRVLVYVSVILVFAAWSNLCMFVNGMKIFSCDLVWNEVEKCFERGLYFKKLLGVCYNFFKEKPNMFILRRLTSCF